MTLNDFLSREVKFHLFEIEDIATQMIYEDDMVKRTDLKFDIQHKIEEILEVLGVKKNG